MISPVEKINFYSVSSARNYFTDSTIIELFPKLNSKFQLFFFFFFFFFKLVNQCRSVVAT